MIMALFLSFLTWFYLFTQGNGPATISVQFLPKLDMKNFASVTWETDGQELSPERSLSIRVVGPKVDVNNLRLRPNIFTCEFNVNPGDLAGARGTFRRQLVREDFVLLPHNITVDPLPVITIRYVKYDERTIELVADRTM